MATVSSRHNSSSSLAPPEAQQSILDESVQVVGVRAFEMRKHIEHRKTLDALKSCSLMLYELRTAQLSPKGYYELYMAIFDHLTWFSTILRNKELLPTPVAAEKSPVAAAPADGEEGKDAKQESAESSISTSLSYLYEVVQYAGNLLPRLYLMLTIGKVWLAEKDAPKRELIRDMLEMCKGIQHPVRGLFLRHYLAGIVKEHLPTGEAEGPQGNLSDTLAFLLTNFTEMNRLWVRLQHTGAAKDAAKRRAERREMRTLVGMSLVQLSQLDGLTVELYQNGLLERLLDQVVACRDDVAQEYLLESIIQVFPDHYHLATASALLKAIAETVATVDHYRILITLIERINTALATALQKDEKDDATIGFFETLLKDFASTLQVKQRDGSLAESLSLFFMLNNVRLQHFPAKEALFSALLQSAAELLATNAKDDPRHFSTLLEPTPFNTIIALLLSPIVGSAALSSAATLASSANTTTLVSAASAPRRSDQSKKGKENEKTVQMPSLHEASLHHAAVYATILHTLPSRLQCQFALRVLQGCMTEKVKIDSVASLTWLLSFLRALYTDDLVAGDKTYVRHPNDLCAAAKLVWLIHHDDPATLLSFVLTRPHASAMGTALLHRYLLLARQTFAINSNKKEEGKLKKVFDAVTTMLKAREAIAAFAPQSIRLAIQAADIADQCHLPDLTYEFFEHAFDLFDHHVHTAADQMNTLTIFRHCLYRIKYMASEPYENLVLKCTLIASRLLKKHDQASTLAKCAILHWKEKHLSIDKVRQDTATASPSATSPTAAATKASATEAGEGGWSSEAAVASAPASKSKSSKNTALLFGESAAPRESENGVPDQAPIERDGQKVLALLQRCLKLTNTISNEHLSTELFVDAFDLSLWFLFHGCPTIAPDFINELANLIRSAASSLPSTTQSSQNVKMDMLTEGTIHVDGIAMGLDHTRAHVARSMQYLVQKRAEDIGQWNDLQI